MTIIRFLVRTAIESFPVDREKKERLLHLLLHERKREISYDL